MLKDISSKKETGKMNEEEKYRPKIGNLMEAVFDVLYLTFDLIAGTVFFVLSKGNRLFIL